MPLPQPLFFSATKTGQGWNVAVAIDAAVFTDVIPGDPKTSAGGDKSKLEQNFQQQNDAWATTAFNTVHPEYPGYYLQGEGPRADIGGGMVKWRRTYFAIPPSWDDWENIQYTFPQTPGYIVLANGVNGVIGRNPYTPRSGVTCRVHHDYFMVGGPSTLGGANQTYANEGQIPLIAVQTYCGKLNPQYFSDPPQVVPVGDIVIGNTKYLETVPDKATYFGWVANAAQYGFSSGRVGTTDNNPGQIVIACVPQRVMGNLWALVTRYVLAQ
jgi:hypothetical protein